MYAKIFPHLTPPCRVAQFFCKVFAIRKLPLGAVVVFVLALIAKIYVGNLLFFLPTRTRIFESNIVHRPPRHQGKYLFFKINTLTVNRHNWCLVQAYRVVIFSVFCTKNCILKKSIFYKYRTVQYNSLAFCGFFRNTGHCKVYCSFNKRKDLFGQFNSSFSLLLFDLAKYVLLTSVLSQEELQEEEGTT